MQPTASYIMKNEDKIVELLSELVHKIDRVSSDVKNLTKQVTTLDFRVESLEGKTNRFEKELRKNVVMSMENNRAIVKIANRLDKLDDHDKRIKVLEKIISKK